MAYEKEKTVKGWGVLRNAPWHFVGMFPSRDAAVEKAKELGDSYIARLGEHQVGTDNFVWSSLDNPNT